MRKFQLAAMVLALTAVLSGCVLSKTTIEERTPDLKYATKGAVALTVIDNRPFVLSGEEDETVEGVARNGYGMPGSFGHMRDDPKVLYTARISEILSKALYNAGSTVTVVQTKKGSSVADAIRGMQQKPFDAGLVVNVIDSRIDAGGFRWSYFFNYEVSVLDSHGVVVATKKYEGEDVDFQREMFHSGSDKGKSYAFDAVLDLEYKKKFAEFLSDRETQAALASVQASPTSVISQTSDDRDGAKRLAALKDLLDKGLITSQDYEMKKAEILRAL